ncbi:beta-lactamase/transpeptidase-like protein [Mycena capillaripes]|nr:beta-lactamase/transpeptidase-like protein [Mycena capillaripes]
MAPPALSTAQTDSFDRILADAVSSKSTPAMFFGVTTADGPIYLRAAGAKFVDDPKGGTIDEDAVFWLCSQTKLITTIAALQLIEQGKIALDTAAETVLPELANPVVVTSYDEAGWVRTTTPAKAKITVAHLLNHTSGLDHWADRAMPLNKLPPAQSHRYKDDEGVSTYFKIIKGSLPGVPLKCEPGTNFTYGFSSDCLGFIVERLSGKSLEQYFQDHIFAPLGITSASFYLTPPLKERLLPLSYRTKSGVLETWNLPSEMEQDPARVRVHFGGLGLYASQKDYLTLLRHLLQIKAGSASKPILSSASVDSLFTPTLPPAAATTLHGFVGFIHPRLDILLGAAQFSHGLFVNTADVPGRRRAGSGAWDGYATTNFFIDPTTGVAAVFGTQLLPLGDPTHEGLYEVLEKELYASLRPRL